MVSEDDEPDTPPSTAEEFDPGDTESAEVDVSTGSSEDAGTEKPVTDDEQTWAVILHASAFSGLVVPFGNLLAPLLVWLIKKDESEFLDANGKAVLNFQLTWTVLMLGALLSLLVGIGFLLVPVVAVAWVALVVLGTVRASERDLYEYPLTIDFIG